MVKDFVLSAKVFHKRYFPKQNSFNYHSYYVVLDMLNLTNKKPLIFGINKLNLYGFYHKDHGYRDGSNSVQWAIDLIKKYNLKYDDIKLVTMPRVLGYLFNPVSFWLCYNKGSLIAVIAEVNNTFRETHSYICHNNNQAITNRCWFEANKDFHVSPFYPRQGLYRFNFSIDLKNNLKNQIIINYYDDDKLQLGTAITGKVKYFSSFSLIKEFLKSPLLTFKVIYLIHWQAIKIVLKKIKYIPKPEQKNPRVSVAKISD